MWWALGIGLVLYLFYLASQHNLQREAEALQIEHDIALQALDKLCTKLDEGSIHGAQLQAKKLAEHSRYGRDLARAVQVIYESLHLVRSTRNRDTLLSRLGVARKTLADARDEYPGWISDELAGRIESQLALAASDSLVRIALASFASALEKADAAKTDKTREKRLQAALADLDQAVAHPELAPSGRAALIAAAEPLRPLPSA
jgi:hypothetical protein